jgi:hypothetical protein
LRPCLPRAPSMRSRAAGRARAKTTNLCISWCCQCGRVLSWGLAASHLGFLERLFAACTRAPRSSVHGVAVMLNPEDTCGFEGDTHEGRNHELQWHARGSAPQPAIREVSPSAPVGVVIPRALLCLGSFALVEPSVPRAARLDRTQNSTVRVQRSAREIATRKPDRPRAR